MKRFLCIALLCAVGCSAVPTAPTNYALQDDEGTGIQYWIPAIFYNLWETVDANIGWDYGFGAHLKLTELARVGILDYSDFNVLGFTKNIFFGEWEVPPMNQRGAVWDLSATVGIGLGASATIHVWEVVDLISVIVGFGYWSFDKDYP